MITARRGIEENSGGADMKHDYLDPNSYASEPGNIHISDEKWNEVAWLLGLNFFEKLRYNRNRKYIDDYIFRGDSQPAVVMSTSPLIISAYSDEMDAVMLLRFPDVLAEKYGIEPGTRLTTSNTYSMFADYSRVKPEYVADDIIPGKKFSGQYFDFRPIVTIFLSDDMDIIEQHTNHVPEQLWEYVEKLSRRYYESFPDRFRDGFFYLK